MTPSTKDPRRANRAVEPEQLALRADIVPESWNEDARSVRVRWTAGADVLRYDWEMGRRYWERLDFAPGACDVSHLNSGRCSVLDNHSRFSCRDVVGRVAPDSATMDQQARTGEATVLFTRAADAQPVVERVKDGTVSGFSFGYERLSVEKTTEMREGYPIYYVRKWKVKELSPTPMPADDGAGTRAQDEHGQADLPNNANGGETPQRNQTMPEIADPKKDEQARAAEIAKAAQDAAEAARAAERTRQAEIRTLCSRHKLPAEFQTRLLDDPNMTSERANKAVLDELVRRDEETDTRSAHRGGFQVGPQEAEKFERVVADSLLMRSGRFGADSGELAVEAKHLNERAWASQRKPLEGAREFMGLRLAQLAALCLRRSGVNTDGMSDVRVWEALMAQRGVAPAHGTADFAKITANVANKALRMGYVESPRSFLPLARRVSVNDFKPRQVHALSTAPDLRRIGQNGEVYYATLGENAQTYAIASYATAFAITRQALINDDTGAFDRLPFMFGAAATRLESDIVWALRTAQQVMDETGQGLYHSSHNNTGTGAINVANISAGYAKMATQRGPTLPDGTLGAILNIMPRFLVVPVARWAEAVQFTSSLVPNTQAAINPFAQGSASPLIPIAEARLDAASTTQWYLDAAPGEFDTQEIAYLAGQDGVYMEQRIGFERDGIELKARHDFGASWIDFRGTYRSSGS